jgi:hypothetical protein
MKIEEIKSDEVREEAIRLALKKTDCYGVCRTRNGALKRTLDEAFIWTVTPQGQKFWYQLFAKKIENTENLKLRHNEN